MAFSSSYLRSRFHSLETTSARSTTSTNTTNSTSTRKEMIPPTPSLPTPAPLPSRSSSQTSPSQPINLLVKVRTFLQSEPSLCTIPILTVVIVASLDNADKQLLASSFPVLERTLNLNVETLGYFSLFTNLSYSLSLPLWGYLVHKYGLENIHTLLSLSCLAWGIATLGIAIFGSSVFGQAIFRAFNGVALASILPLSQTILVEFIPLNMRGRAFGLLSLCEKLAGTLAAASVVYFMDNWEVPYIILAIGSIFMSFVAHKELNMKLHKKLRPKQQHHVGQRDEKATKTGITGTTNTMTLCQIIKRIVKIPAFMCLVAQGIFGGTPWDMMSFLLLLMDWRGFTKEQIVSMQFTMGISGTLGGWLGGVLGDYLATAIDTTCLFVRTRRNNCHNDDHHQCQQPSKMKMMKGRILVAFTSIVGGIPLYGLFLFSTTYGWAILWLNLFNIWASWTPAAANRPICAELARNPSERAQIISTWILLEKTSAAVFGAPLVGLLTSGMIDDKNENTGFASGVGNEGKAKALAWNIFLLSTLFWSIAAFFWLVMAYTLKDQDDTMMQTEKETKDQGGRKDDYVEVSTLIDDEEENSNATVEERGVEITRRLTLTS